MKKGETFTKKLVFVIPELSTGGAERILAWLASYFVGKEEYIVIVISLASSPLKGPFHQINNQVELTYLKLDKQSSNVFDGLINNIWRLNKLRAEFRKESPDLVIAFIHKAGIWSLLSSIGLKIPIIVSERTNPYRQNLAKSWVILRKVLYPLARAIVVQTSAAADYFPKRLRHKLFIIPNPVIPKINQVQHTEVKTITGVGRLAPEKCFDVLINAFSMLAPIFPEWNLKIWGEGPDRNRLQSLIEQCGLQERAFLSGLTKPDQYWEDETGIFVLSSRFEGFPNVLGEAMAAGLPVVACDCSSSVREIVDDDNSGLIIDVDDVSQMTNALESLMRDYIVREKLGRNARNSIARFDPDQIILHWESLIEECIS